MTRRFGFLISGALFVMACSSAPDSGRSASGSSSGAAGTSGVSGGADGGTSGAARQGNAGATGASGQPGPEGGLTFSSGAGCDGVLARTGGTTLALATDGTDAYVVIAGASGERVISVAKGGQLTQLATVPSDKEIIDIQSPALAVDASAFYVDAVRGGDRPLVRVDRASGTQTILAQIEPNGTRRNPLFLADAQYVYFQATDAGALNGALARVPKTGGSPEALADLFYGEQGLDLWLFQDGAAVYDVSDGGKGVFSVARASKAGPTPMQGAGYGVDFFSYDVSACGGDPFNVAFDPGSGFFASCSTTGAAWLYALPASTTPNVTLSAPAVPMPTLKNLNLTGLVAQKGNLYMVADAPAGSGQQLYRVPEGGGAPTPILATSYPNQMTASDTTLFLSTSCGVQSVGL